MKIYEAEHRIVAYRAEGLCHDQAEQTLATTSPAGSAERIKPASRC